MSGWHHRASSEIMMGNGTLLATFDPLGEIDQLFAPHIDALQSRLGAFRTSVLIPSHSENRAPEILRIDPEVFYVRLQLLPGSQVLLVEYHHRYRPIQINRRLGIHPTEPVILDQWRIRDENAGLLHESIPWIGNTTSAHCSLYHPTFNGLVHHRGRRWLGVIARRTLQWVRVGHLSDHDRYRLWSGERVEPPLGAADLAGFPASTVAPGWDQVVQGPATWGAMAAGPAADIEFVIACAESERHLERLLESLAKVPSHRYFEVIESMVARRHAPAVPTLDKINNSNVRMLCERSIDVLHGLQDRDTGALMAAAEVDPHSALSGGYGYSWPRDGAYLASGLSAFGFHDQVGKYFDFLAETQDPSGAWWQRYLATGHAGPSWGRIQIDEPASVIGAAWLHYRQTQNLLWLERFWPTLEKGLAFLDQFHSGDFPLGVPSHDLWEERMGIHAYSLGAVSAAFLAGAAMARELSNHPMQLHYFRRSRQIRSMLDEYFLPPDGSIRRSRIASVAELRSGGGHWDESADVSLLGLVKPFRILNAADPRVHRMVDALRSKLWVRPAGGLMRYEWDAYRGGNPWILTTLWLAMIELELGNYSEARECFQWATSKSTALGMLPEQVHRETGKPYWVIPLGWSHAMYLSFVKEVLDRRVHEILW